MWPTSARARNLTLLLALTFLFVCAQDQTAAPWRRALFFAHIGAFLLWQPLISGERSLSGSQIAMLAGIGAMLAAFFSGWVLFGWTVLVAALVGGGGLEYASRAERRFHLGAFTFVLGLVFLMVLPALLPEPLRAEAIPGRAREWSIGVLWCGLALLVAGAWRAVPAPGSRTFTPPYDPLHGLWILVLVLLVATCGLALMLLDRRSYLAAIGLTLGGIAALLVVVDLLWRRGGSGPGERGALALLLSRHLMSYGMPYELWLERLAILDAEEPDPERFLRSAITALGEFAPLTGARWGGALPSGSFGAASADHVESFELPGDGESAQPARITLHLRRPVSIAFAWHLKLLLQVAVQFHAAKVRERRASELRHLRAVHETGARLTHDVKNLLQSLEGLIGAAATLDDRDVRHLMQRQLPEIGRRLAQTLDKLQRPEATGSEDVEAGPWWEALESQYAPQSVRFEGAPPSAGARVPVPLFSAAADNLLQNALQKRKVEPGVNVRICLEAGDSGPALQVEDSGRAVAAEIAERLFRGPVESTNGLGIGLVQVARLAETQGMRIALVENRDGCVRFRLERI
jgi:signal transduction histidine kinase